MGYQVVEGLGGEQERACQVLLIIHWERGSNSKAAKDLTHGMLGFESLQFS